VPTQLQRVSSRKRRLIASGIAFELSDAKYAHFTRASGVRAATVLGCEARHETLHRVKRVTDLRQFFQN
jgi:hypothetical protein